jgi:hypothetical protein
MELKIPRIYIRLALNWPPELVLSKTRFHFCYKLKSALRAEKKESYPINLHESKASEPSNTMCCTNNSICHWAVPITDWNDISNDPSEANYYCRLVLQFVWGEDPQC